MKNKYILLTPERADRIRHMLAGLVSITNDKSRESIIAEWRWLGEESDKLKGIR